jgi:hypothetical protein
VKRVLSGVVGKLAALVGVSLIMATTASATGGPSGFSDGEWKGGMVWDASVQFPDAYGSGDSTGKFTMQLTGGVPTGTFDYLVPSATGETTDATAELKVQASGVVGGTADEVSLIASSAAVTGTVIVEGFSDPFPVDFALGAGELEPLPLDVVSISCSTASGVFTTFATELGAVVTGAGGALSVQQAKWWATRVGNAGATTEDQYLAINELVADGEALANAIDDGTFDATALEAVLRRAEEFSRGIARNKECEIETPGHFSTVIAVVVADILDRMANHEDAFDVYQFTTAIIAGVQSGAIGDSAGPGSQALTDKIGNVLASKFAAAAAAGNAGDLSAIHVAALLIGNEQLAADALNELGKLP